MTKLADKPLRKAFITVLSSAALLCASMPVQLAEWMLDHGPQQMAPLAFKLRDVAILWPTPISFETMRAAFLRLID